MTCEIHVCHIDLLLVGSLGLLCLGVLMLYKDVTVKTIKKQPASTSGNFGDLNLYCRRHRAYRSMLRMNPELTLRSEWRLIQIRQLVSMIVEIGGYKSCSKCLRYVICGKSGESVVLGFAKNHVCSRMSELAVHGFWLSIWEIFGWGILAYTAISDWAVMHLSFR